MFRYVPAELLKNPQNENKIHTILEKVKSDDFVFEGAFTIEDALNEIQELGETAFVEFFKGESKQNT